MPPPPPEAQPPPLWGSEEHVRGLFEGTGVEPEFAREAATMAFESPEEALALYEHKFGPIVMAKATLEPQGRWEALRDDLLAFFREHGAENGGGTTIRAEYLVVTGGKLA